VTALRVSVIYAVGEFWKLVGKRTHPEGKDLRWKSFLRQDELLADVIQAIIILQEAFFFSKNHRLWDRLVGICLDF